MGLVDEHYGIRTEDKNAIQEAVSGIFDYFIEYHANYMATVPMDEREEMLRSFKKTFQEFFKRILSEALNRNAIPDEEGS